jgi:hypothetical protein
MAAMEYELTNKVAEAKGGVKGLSRAKEQAVMQAAALRVGGSSGPAARGQGRSCSCKRRAGTPGGCCCALAGG